MYQFCLLWWGEGVFLLFEDNSLLYFSILKFFNLFLRKKRMKQFMVLVLDWLVFFLCLLGEVGQLMFMENVYFGKLVSGVYKLIIFYFYIIKRKCVCSVLDEVIILYFFFGKILVFIFVFIEYCLGDIWICYMN